MRKCIGSALLLTVLSVLPAFAAAQRRAVSETGPKNELGVDLAFQYVSYGSNGGSGVQLAAPVDARVGWLSRSGNLFAAPAALSGHSTTGPVVLALSGFAEARPRPPAPAGGPFPFTAMPRNDRRPHGYPVSHSL